MSTLRDLRQKILAVGNIRKITQAMELVAAARLRKAQVKAESARPYALKLNEILERLIAAAGELHHPLITSVNVTPEVKKIGLVVIAGDRGLCGGYNQGVFSAAEKFIQKHSSAQITLITVGRKSCEHFAKSRLNIAYKIPEWGGKITYLQIEEFSMSLIDFYLNGQFDEIWLVYTHFVNLMVREVLIEKFLNIETKASTEQKINYIFEPDAASIFAKLLPHYCITKIQSALNDAYAAELAARISSMRSATKNAQEMIEKLTLMRNKVRQAGITKELIEITSGAEILR